MSDKKEAMIIEDLLTTLSKKRRECKKSYEHKPMFEVYLNAAAYTEIMADQTLWMPSIKEELKEKETILGNKAYALMSRCTDNQPRFIIQEIVTTDDSETPTWP